MEHAAAAGQGAARLHGSCCVGGPTHTEQQLPLEQVSLQVQGVLVQGDVGGGVRVVGDDLAGCGGEEGVQGRERLGMVALSCAASAVASWQPLAVTRLQAAMHTVVSSGCKSTKQDGGIVSGTPCRIGNAAR